MHFDNFLVIVVKLFTINSYCKHPLILIFRNAMHNLRPAKAASFSFAWIEIISHRVFIGKMLALNRNHKVLLIFLLTFMCNVMC